MQSKTRAPPRRPSISRDEMENSSLAQVLSQRLTNMEQQLFLLRDDLKNAVGTLKEKDREILNLQNRITLAERRRDLEEAGQLVDESLKDVSTASKSNSKREVLENEVVTLARKLEEMEKFFGDYGLAWVKEDALDEKDPNNLWIRKSNIHYTPDFEKVFLVVEELNLGNAEPQIVRKGNTAQFKTAQLLNLTLYADGIQLENNPFRKYDSPSVEEFFRDLEDGYFPTELKGSHPEGVIFKVKDKRTISFADDPDKRPVISPDAKSDVKAASPASSPTSLSSLRAAARRSTSLGGSGTPKTDKNAKDTFAASSSRKRNLSKRASSLKKTPSRPSRSSGEAKQLDQSDEPKRKSDPTSDNGPTDDGEAVPPSTVGPPGEDSFGSKKPDAADTGEAPKPVVPPEGKPSGDGADQVLPISEGKEVGEVPGGGSPGDATSDTTGAVIPPVPPNQEKPNPEQDFKELFRGKTPGSSAERLPPHAVEPTLGGPKDPYGLPKPPFPSTSNTTADVRSLPLGPPSKQFDNFVFPKTTETQTSLTLMPGIQPAPAAAQTPLAPCPQPTHVTNITYNEAPITVQMTPSEFMPTSHGAAHPPDVRGGVPCPNHHPHPCNCVRAPCDTCPEEPKDGVFGSVGLAKFPAETEYRERFTESAINNKNVLEFKKRSQEARGLQPEVRSPSPAPVPRQPAATLLVGPDEAPIPPDPVQPHNLIDPNVKWEHFTYLGHPKGQEPVHTQEATNEPNSRKRPSSKRKPSPQVVQLNEKTSDRMISVRLRTKSGSKEFLAHLYPEEQVSRLWSLLKVNDRSHSLSTADNKVIPPDAVATEISTDQILRIVRSKSEGSTVASRFEPRRFPEFALKDPEYFKTPTDGKENRGSAKKKPDQNVFHKTYSRSLKDHIDEVRSMMREDENLDGDNDSRDLFISSRLNRDWLSKKAYHKNSVARVSSKELEKMLEQFKSQDFSTKAVSKEPVMSVTDNQPATMKAAGNPDSSPPGIVLDDAESTLLVPQRYAKDSHGGLSSHMSGQSISSEANRSSSLISESKVDIGSYVLEKRQKIKITDLSAPPADYPGSTSSIDLHVPLRESNDVTAKSSHSLIFKRQSSSSSAISRRMQSQSNVSLKVGLPEHIRECSNLDKQFQSEQFQRECDKAELSEWNGAVPVENINAESHSELPAASKLCNTEASPIGCEDSSNQPARKERYFGPSGIGHDGFEAATLLEIVKAMLEAEKEHGKDEEKLKQARRIVVPKPSPEPATRPSGLSIPNDVAEELEALRKSSQPLQSTHQKNQPHAVDRVYVERLLGEIRTKRCTLDEAIKEISKGSTPML